jgi:raffinose/stachyose/melibiose transport system substrate-binding protein
MSRRMAASTVHHGPPRAGTPAGRTISVAVVLATMVATAACSDAGEEGGRVEVEFFQFKGEAVGTFDALIEQFEAEHPEIDIVQNNVPSADAALRTRLVKNDIPAVMTLNGNGATYGDLASAEIFRDFTGDPALEATLEGPQETLAALGGPEGEMNGVPYALNANGVIYDVAFFEELDVDPPRTWSELISAAETVEAAGRTPFYFTWAEAWTTLPLFHAVTQNTTGDSFWPDRISGATSFAEEWQVAMDKMLELKEHGPDDPFRFDYNTGNRAIADGEAAMYVQGNWAIPSIREINPDVQLGMFALPVTDEPEDNRLVSGVDLLLTMPREETPHDEEALTFLRWLTEQGPAAQYAEEQNAFSAVEGVEQEDPALATLNPYFEEGRTVGFADHYIPSSIPLENLVQGFLIDGRSEAFLADLDEQFDIVQARRG